MTDPVTIAIIAAGAPTLLSLATLWTSLKNGTKADAIHILVNSNLTRVKSDLEIALSRQTKLEALIISLREELNDLKAHG